MRPAGMNPPEQRLMFTVRQFETYRLGFFAAGVICGTAASIVVGLAICFGG